MNTKSSKLPQYVRAFEHYDLSLARRALAEAEEARREPPKIWTVAELMELPPAPNVWRHDSGINTLEYSPEGYGDSSYQIDLDEVTDARKALEWLAHIAGKTWSDEPCVMKDLVRHMAARFAWK